MKKVIVLIYVVLFYSMAIACESGRFNIFYLPLEADFYIPPTREYIIQHGINFEMDSCELTSLFKEIFEQEGAEPQSEDYKGLRILIVNKKDGRELFITSDKKILFEGKKYNIGVRIVDNVLSEIVNLIKTKKPK